jgi:hypothetical protein
MDMIFGSGFTPAISFLVINHLGFTKNIGVPSNLTYPLQYGKLTRVN